MPGVVRTTAIGSNDRLYYYHYYYYYYYYYYTQTHTHTPCTQTHTHTARAGSECTVPMLSVWVVATRQSL